MTYENTNNQKFNGVKTSKKHSALTRKALEHLEILKKYYYVDMDKRIVTVPFHFEKATEFIDATLGSKKHPVITREYLAKISAIAKSIPREFKIDVDITINDYVGYNHKHIAKSLIDAFEMFQYEADKDKGMTNLKIAILIGLGIVIFVWLFYLHYKNIFAQFDSTYKGNVYHDVIHEIVYIVAEVVIWEALYIIFLPNHDYKDISYKIVSRLNILYIRDKNGKLLNEINGKKMYNQIKVATKSELVARKLLLIAGVALIAISLCKLTDLVEICLSLNGWKLAVALSVNLSVFICSMLTGIGSISYYRDKGPFKKIAKVFVGLTTIGCIVEICVGTLLFGYLGAMTIKILVLTSLLLVLSIVYIICISILRVKAKPTRKEIYIAQEAKEKKMKSKVIK